MKKAIVITLGVIIGVTGVLAICAHLADAARLALYVPEDDDDEDDEDDDEDEDEEEEEERPRRKKGKSKDWQSRNFLDDDDLEFEFLDLK